MNKVYNFSYKKYIPLLALTLLLFISIGYAYLSSTLNIYGTSGISAASWNVYFDNLNNIDGVDPIHAPEINTDKNQINFEVLLDKPGDYYEFTVDTVNDGSIDAMVNMVSQTELSETDKKYLYYDINYTDGKKVRKYDFLNAGETKTIKVKVGYKTTQELTVEDLDEDGTDLNLNLTINYVQKDETQVEYPTLATYQNLGFRDSSYLNKIKTVTFNDEINIPANTVQTWDVSEKRDNSVQAYIIPNSEDSKMYDLYIEGNDGVSANPNSSKLFKGMYNLLEIKNIEYFNTSKVTDISFMFSYCWSLTELDISNFETSKITDMTSLFECCRKITFLDISVFDTSNVQGMTNMFRYCDSLTELDVSGFDTSNVSGMGGMFCGVPCTIDVSNFETKNVTHMWEMFSMCESNIIDVSGFDTSNVEDMSAMFKSCDATLLDVSNFDTSNVTDMGGMFSQCENLLELDVSHFDTSNVTDMYRMFFDCSDLTIIDISNFDMSKVENIEEMFGTGNESEKVYWYYFHKVYIPKTSGLLNNTTTTLFGKDSTVYLNGTFIIGIEGVIETSSHENYGNNNNYIVLGTWDFSSKCSTVDIEITYETESTSYDWLSITSGNDYIAGTSYTDNRDYLDINGTVVNTTGEDSNIRFGGSSKTTVTFTDVAMPTGSVIFRSDSSSSNYYGAKVVVTPHTD